MKDLKNKRLSPRVTEELKNKFETIAMQYGPNASAVLELLIQAFVDAHEKNHGRLVWPPEINYYIETPPTAQQLRLVAEELPQYKIRHDD